MMTMDEMKKVAPYYQEEAKKRAAKTDVKRQECIKQATFRVINDLSEKIESQVKAGEKQVVAKSLRFQAGGDGLGHLVVKRGDKIRSGYGKGKDYETIQLDPIHGNIFDVQKVIDFFETHGVPIEMNHLATIWNCCRGESCDQFFVQFDL